MKITLKKPIVERATRDKVFVVKEMDFAMKPILGESLGDDARVFAGSVEAIDGETFVLEPELVDSSDLQAILRLWASHGCQQL